MGRHLHRAKRYFGTDTRGLLEGGRYALLHTRSMEFDDLRPYVPGDDVRDIDWKATARSGTVLIKRFVSERHHKILLVADAGRNMTALAPSGEVKCDVAVAILGAFGLITLGRADEIGIVYGDSRGCAAIRNRRGETHVEGMLDRFYRHATGHPATSDIVSQLHGFESPPWRGCARKSLHCNLFRRLTRLRRTPPGHRHRHHRPGCRPVGPTSLPRRWDRPVTDSAISRRTGCQVPGRHHRVRTN